MLRRLCLATNQPRPSLHNIVGHQLYPAMSNPTRVSERTEKILISTFRPARKWIFLVSFFSCSFILKRKPKRLLHNFIFFINISAFGLHCCKISEVASQRQEKKWKKLTPGRGGNGRGERVKEHSCKTTAVPSTQSSGSSKIYFNFQKGLKATLADLLSINHREKLFMQPKKFFVLRERKNFSIFSLYSANSLVVGLWKLQAQQKVRWGKIVFPSKAFSSLRVKSDPSRHCCSLFSG